MSTAATGNNTTVLDLTANVRTIERNTVASSSRASYISTLANFIVFLYTTAGYQKYLKQDAITATFDPAAKNDEDARKEADTANQKKKKRKRAAKKDTKTVKWSHPLLYDESKRLLGLMNRSNPGACPINLNGDNRMKLSPHTWLPRRNLLKLTNTWLIHTIALPVEAKINQSS